MSEEAGPAPRRRRVLRALVFGLVLLAGIGAAGFGAWRWALGQYRGPGPLTEARAVVIPRGAGPPLVAERLAEAGVVADGRLFAIAAVATEKQGPLRAGEFAFPAGVSVADALAILRAGRTVQRRLTIPEGLTVAQTLALVERAEGLTGTIDEAPPEGSLLPETWAYAWGDSRASVIRRMSEGMDRALAEAWAGRAPNLPLATAREALILGSIVERETGVAEERGRVAGVFLNRLRRGMPLQSDPTVIYAVSGGTGVLDRPLSRADLEADSPHNTYRARALPPTPIASPGRASLAAVLRPTATEALYFVADGSGGHAFAVTLEEHTRNVTRLRAIERERAARGGG